MKTCSDEPVCGTEIYIQSTLIISTLDTTTKFVILTISLAQKPALKRWQLIRHYAEILFFVFPGCMFWIFVRIASPRRFLQISKTCVLWRNKNNTWQLLHIILLINNPLKQQIHFILKTIFLKKKKKKKKKKNAVVLTRVHCIVDSHYFKHWQLKLQLKLN